MDCVKDESTKKSMQKDVKKFYIFFNFFKIFRQTKLSSKSKIIKKEKKKL